MMELRADVLASADSVARAQSQGMGLHLVPVSAAVRKRLNLPNGIGVAVDRVAPGSQAETLGMKAGDTILEVNDRPVRSPGDVPTVYGRPDPKTGDTVAMLVRGQEKAMWLSLFVGHVDVADLLAQPPSVQANVPAARDASASKR
jgi:S1-C subfamily serine protease